LLSSVPTFLWVEEKPSSAHINAGRKTIRLAFEKLAQTFRDVRNYKEFIKYMIAFLIYNDGIMMLMDFAAIIGATLFGMKQIQLIIFVIVIQIAGAFGALLFGRIADKKSSKDAILLSLIILIASVTGLFFIKEIFWFFVVGFLAGFSLSGAQATSRTMVSQLAPTTKTAEFYGFLSVAGRTSTFVGPLVFGTISYRAHNWYASRGFDMITSEQYGLLWAIGSIVAFLLIGMLVLLLVKRVSAKEPIQY
jgi:UMF1 family MFS transporter